MPLACAGGGEICNRMVVDVACTILTRGGLAGRASGVIANFVVDDDADDDDDDDEKGKDVGSAKLRLIITLYGVYGKSDGKNAPC